MAASFELHAGAENSHTQHARQSKIDTAAIINYLHERIEREHIDALKHRVGCLKASLKLCPRPPEVDSEVAAKTTHLTMKGFALLPCLLALIMSRITLVRSLEKGKEGTPFASLRSPEKGNAKKNKKKKNNDEGKKKRLKGKSSFPAESRFYIAAPSDTPSMVPSEKPSTVPSAVSFPVRSTMPSVGDLRIPSNHTNKTTTSPGIVPIKESKLSQTNTSTGAATHGLSLIQTTEGPVMPLYNESVEATGPIPVSFEGVIWHDENRNGVMDSSESRVFGMTAKAKSCDNNRTVAVAFSQADGRYRLGAIGPAGCYYVQFLESQEYIFTLPSGGQTNKVRLKSGESASKSAGIMYALTTDPTVQPTEHQPPAFTDNQTTMPIENQATGRPTVLPTPSPQSGRQLPCLKLNLFETSGALSRGAVADVATAVNVFYNAQLSNHYNRNGQYFQMIRLMPGDQSTITQQHVHEQSEPLRRLIQGTAINFDSTIEFRGKGAPSTSEIADVIANLSEDLHTAILEIENTELNDFNEVRVNFVKNFHGINGISDKDPEDKRASAAGLILPLALLFVIIVTLARYKRGKSETREDSIHDTEGGDKTLQTTPVSKINAVSNDLNDCSNDFNPCSVESSVLSSKHNWSECEKNAATSKVTVDRHLDTEGGDEMVQATHDSKINAIGDDLNDCSVERLVLPLATYWNGHAKSASFENTTYHAGETGGTLQEQYEVELESGMLQSAAVINGKGTLALEREGNTSDIPKCWSISPNSSDSSIVISDEAPAIHGREAATLRNSFVDPYDISSDDSTSSVYHSFDDSSTESCLVVVAMVSHE